ncbi:hypothetical protein BATDEDRAFT_92257 [Batrachochytrium dendrobatidis JAM81]|uniref:SAGA-associated factor 11 n=2 Tax=Batrachochytrium dendrobatidis TaxID=109871 RepID=F4PCX9_BATDJ|nr:uncharacterized protein BATDEDRAFT_92257 [Batrachochytrium dendrobatidis JAM81]EGF76937.1 hypothetical protein BATDEDRAFT_92257 [Batrachochytrium dendrobatidis JAM81]OAJ45059.1 hypothetical protein, variant [Batrachochytrium dendrobatidis JEL423]|eukprot:XP_006682509.1 hypothetical protein BATDEDRAFT_92257 [Batrachochytrium dendrobatidis JAM81]
MLYCNWQSKASGVGLDIFGANPSQTNGEKYQCFNCQNLFPSVRFAPHLEKCLGLGRTSSRVASRKIASSERLSSPTPGMNNDSDTDKEFSLEKKKKQRKPSPIRKITLKKAKTDGSPGSSQFIKKVKLSKPLGTSGYLPFQSHPGSSLTQIVAKGGRADDDSSAYAPSDGA